MQETKKDKEETKKDKEETEKDKETEMDKKETGRKENKMLKKEVRVGGCVQALAYMKTEQDGVSIPDVDRVMAKLDQFKTRLRKEEALQDKLRSEEEGRMTVDA